MQGTASPAWRRICRRSASVAVRDVGGETILVPVEEERARMDRLFTLNPIGAFIWHELDGERDLTAIHRKLLERFEVTAQEARDDLFEYVERLLAAGLIELVGDQEKES